LEQRDPWRGCLIGSAGQRRCQAGPSRNRVDAAQHVAQAFEFASEIGEDLFLSGDIELFDRGDGLVGFHRPTTQRRRPRIWMGFEESKIVGRGASGRIGSHGCVEIDGHHGN
jgi:hypothetical protein